MRSFWKVFVALALMLPLGAFVAGTLVASAADELLRDHVVHGGMEPRLTAALRAVREGVRSVHIIDGSVPSALLLEVLTAEGVGTAVRSDAHPDFFADSRAYMLSPI